MSAETASHGSVAAESSSVRPAPPRTRWVLLLVGVGIALAALNLRTAITSVGPVLDEVTAGLGMSAVGAGILTTLPVLCFALFGGLTPALARRLGDHHVLVYALTALTVGLTARAIVSEPWMFLALSVVALTGGAVGNVLLPALVKQHFPHRVGLMTTVYTTGLAVGTAIAAGVTVPVEQATGEWRVALGMYALFGLMAVLPWLAVLRHGTRPGAEKTGLSFLQVLRTGIGWQAVLYFGTQSAVAYILFGWYAQMLRDQGMDASTAGVVLAYLTTLGIPMSLLLPTLLTRVRNHRGFVLLFVGTYLAGFADSGSPPPRRMGVDHTHRCGDGQLRLRPDDVCPAHPHQGGHRRTVRRRAEPGLPLGRGRTVLLRSAARSDRRLVRAAAPAGVPGRGNLGVGWFLGRPRYLEDAVEALEQDSV